MDDRCDEGAGAYDGMKGVNEEGDGQICSNARLSTVSGAALFFLLTYQWKERKGTKSNQPSDVGLKYHK